jgi:hypothetical protein
MFRPKIIQFNQVECSKSSFPVAPSGDEKVFTTKRTHFCMSRQKMSLFNQVFSWHNWKFDPSMIRPSDISNLQWIDPAMNRPTMSRLCDVFDLAMNRPAMNRGFVFHMTFHLEKLAGTKNGSNLVVE